MIDSVPVFFPTPLVQATDNTQELDQENPFNYQHTKSFAQILHGLKSSLVLSTYQTGKVVMFSPKNESQMIQLPRNFRKPMGVASYDKHLAIACLNELILTHRSANAAKAYPKMPDVYDASYLPRSTHFTGAVDTHDISYGKGGLWAVITQFSCIAQYKCVFCINANIFISHKINLSKNNDCADNK